MSSQSVAQQHHDKGRSGYGQGSKTSPFPTDHIKREITMGRASYWALLGSDMPGKRDCVAMGDQIWLL